MAVNLKWPLLVALLGVALLSHPGLAKVEQFQDDQGTLHIGNSGKEDPGKPGTPPRLNARLLPNPETSQPEAPPVTAPPSQAQEAPPAQPVAEPPGEEAEAPETVIDQQEIASSPEESQEEAPAPIELQPPTGLSSGSVNPYRTTHGRR